MCIPGGGWGNDSNTDGNPVLGKQPVGGTMWVDIEAPEGVTEADISSCRRKMTISRAGKSRVH